MTLDFIGSHFNYAVVIVLMMAGLYVLFSTGNLVKKMVGLSVFQTSVFLLYISIGKVTGGQPPILEMSHGKDYEDKGAYEETVDSPGEPGDYATEESVSDHGGEAAHDSSDEAHAEPAYSNPLPHVLILTAIVVGVATLAVGLSLVVRIREVYGTIEDEEISRADYETMAGDS